MSNNIKFGMMVISKGWADSVGYPGIHMASNMKVTLLIKLAYGHPGACVCFVCVMHV